MLALWHVHQSLLGKLVLFNIRLAEINAALKHWDELIWWISFMIPEDIIVLWSTFLAFSSFVSSEVKNVIFAVVDHLVGNLDKKTGHSFVGVVVSGDGMNHFDTVHQGWKSLFNAFGVAIIEWFNELFEGLKIFHVVFGFIKCLSNSKFNASPL